MIKTIGIDNKKFNIAEGDVNVIPGIKTVTTANSVGSTKNFETFDIKNQNANPIMRNPATTLTSAKTRIPLLVLVNIFVRTNCIPSFL